MESEFNVFEPRLKSAKNRFQLSAGLNLETLNTIEVEPTIFALRLKFKPRLKFFKFGLGSDYPHLFLDYLNSYIESKSRLPFQSFLFPSIHKNKLW